MATLSSVSSLQASIAIAERQVQQDQTRVTQDASRLEQSRVQLTKDKQDLSDTQAKSRQAEQTASTLEPAAPPALRLNRAIEKPPVSQQTLPPELSTRKPQVNTLGETIGKIINIVA